MGMLLSEHSGVRSQDSRAPIYANYDPSVHLGSRSAPVVCTKGRYGPPLMCTHAERCREHARTMVLRVAGPLSPTLGERCSIMCSGTDFGDLPSSPQIYPEDNWHFLVCAPCSYFLLHYSVFLFPTLRAIHTKTITPSRSERVTRHMEPPLPSDDSLVAPWLERILVVDPFRLSHAAAQAAVADITLSTGELRTLRGTLLGQPRWEEFLASLARVVGAALNFDEDMSADAAQSLLEHIDEVLFVDVTAACVLRVWYRGQTIRHAKEILNYGVYPWTVFADSPAKEVHEAFRRLALKCSVTSAPDAYAALVKAKDLLLGHVRGCMRCGWPWWLREEARRERLMCSACSTSASEPPYLALQIIFTHFNTVTLSGISRVSRTWRALIDSGECFRVISISPHVAVGAALQGKSAWQRWAWYRPQVKAAFNNGVLARLLSKASSQLTCLYLDDLPLVTSAGLRGLGQAHGLRALVVRDCQHVKPAQLASYLPATLRCLRLEGASMPSASALASLRPVLSARCPALQLALETCGTCLRVCLPDEGLRCEECGRSSCSGGCGGVCYKCKDEECGKAYCSACQPRASCGGGCGDDFCPSCATEALPHGPCGVCGASCCEGCQANQAWLNACGHCETAYYCVNCISEWQLLDFCNACGHSCMECSMMAECPDCESEHCGRCSPAVVVKERCVVCGSSSEACGRCREAASWATCSHCDAPVCAECADGAVEETGRRVRARRCGACTNVYCADCRPDRVLECHVCDAAFACDTPACLAQNGRAGCAHGCGKLTCASCDCDCAGAGADAAHPGQWVEERDC